VVERQTQVAEPAKFNRWCQFKAGGWDVLYLYCLYEGTRVVGWPAAGPLQDDQSEENRHDASSPHTITSQDFVRLRG